MGSVVHVEFLDNAGGIFHNMVVVFLGVLEGLDFLSDSHIFEYFAADSVHA